MNERKSAREELIEKLVRIIEEKKALIEKYLPEEAREKYYDLLARQVSLEDYLQEHDDEYLEKARSFDWGKCPIASPWNEEARGFEPSLLDSGDFIKPCENTDCPQYESCWASKSTKPPEGRIG